MTSLFVTSIERFYEGAKWNPLSPLGPSVSTRTCGHSAGGNSQSSLLGTPGKKVECFFVFGFILLDILEIGAVDSDKELPKS